MFFEMILNNTEINICKGRGKFVFASAFAYVKTQTLKTRNQLLKRFKDEILS